MTSFSLKDLEFVIDNLSGAGANGDYTPPSMQWYDSRVLYMPEGVYYKAGPRANQQYVDLKNAGDYWVLGEPLFFNIDDATFSGTTGSGFLPGGKQTDTWYGVWLVDVGGGPSPVLLPFSSVSSMTNPSGITTIGVGSLTSVSGGVEGYRALSFSNYLWEITDQKLLNILSYASPPESLDGASNTSTDYATPQMTSDTAPSPYVVSYSSIYSGYPGWTAFNRNTGDFWHSASGLPVWLAIDLGYRRLINKYRIAQRVGYHIPQNWTFQGSNDGSVWTTLHTVTGASYPSSPWTDWLTFVATVPYRHYRIYVTQSYSSTYANIAEMHLVEDARYTSSITVEGGQAAPFPGRYFPSVAQSDDSCWFFAGNQQDGGLPSDLWRFDFDSEQWFKISTNTGPSLVQYAALCYDSTSNSLYTTFGWGTTYQVWKCALGEGNTGTWSSLSPGGTNPGVRLMPSYAWDFTRRRLWIYGGRVSTTVQDDLFYYDVAANTWTRPCDGCTPGAKEFVSMVYDPVNDSLILWAGATDTNFTTSTTMHKYNITAGTWSSVSMTGAPAGLAAGGTVYLDGYMYVVGGGTSAYGLSDACYRFKISNSTWEELPRYNSSYIRGNTLAVNPTTSGIYSFHGYDQGSTNRSVENWKFLVNENEWRRVDTSAELSTSSKLLLCPPQSMPSLYLGCVYIESDGGIRPFLKDGWSYTWYNQGSSDKYRIQGYWGTGFSNTGISSVVPPSAYEVKLGVTGGSTSAMNNFRVGLCGNDSGGSLAAGFDSPQTSDRSNEKDRQTVNLCLTWYNENASGSQRYGQTVDYMLSVNQLIRNHFWGNNTTPTAGHFTIAGFLE
jgi:hypothetical protein